MIDSSRVLLEIIMTDGRNFQIITSIDEAGSFRDAWNEKLVDEKAGVLIPPILRISGVTDHRDANKTELNIKISEITAVNLMEIKI